MLLLKYPHYVYKVRDTHKLKKVSKYICQLLGKGESIKTGHPCPQTPVALLVTVAANRGREPWENLSEWQWLLGGENDQCSWQQASWSLKKNGELWKGVTGYLRSRLYHSVWCSKASVFLGGQSHCVNHPGLCSPQPQGGSNCTCPWHCPWRVWARTRFFTHLASQGELHMGICHLWDPL